MSRRWNVLFAGLAIAAAAVIGGVFFLRFVQARLVLQRIVPSAAVAMLIVAASIGCGRVAIALARRFVARLRAANGDEAEVDVADEFLIGVSVYGSLVTLIALAGLVNQWTILVFTLACAAYGAIKGWRRVAELASSISMRGVTILLPPIVIAFIAALTPVNSPDELAYKLALPKQYLLYGRMLDLPLNSQSYFPASVYMADLGALTFAGGTAARLLHFIIYLVVLRVIYRLSSRLSSNASLLPVAVVAWTPALAIIAGWAWAEWAMIGFLLLSLLRWHDFLDSRNATDLAISAAALGGALASKYTALPWLAIFVPLAVFRLRSWRPIVAAAVIVTAIGGLFYVRNLLWTGSPIAPFLLANSPPVTQYRSSAGGWSELIHGYDILHKDIIDDSLGILLPVMVLLSPLALLTRTRPIVDTFVVGLGQMLILVPLAPTSRLIALALVPLAILGASAAARTWSRKWLFVPVALALYAQLLLVAYVFVTSQDFLRYVVGAETEETNLRRTRDYVGAYRWIADHTAPDAKLLLLAENRTFHLERRAMAAGNLDGPRVAAWLAQFRSVDEMRDGIAREGVTHIVVHTPWYRIDLPGTPSPRMLEKEYLLIVAPRTHMVLRQYLATHARIVYKDAAFVVYAI